MNSRRAIEITVLLEFIIIIIALVWHGITLEALQTATRFSGRLSLGIFSFIFLFDNKPEKLHPFLSPQFYLVFAVAHSIHLLELLWYNGFSDNRLISMRVMGGAIAYLLILLMPLVQYFFNKHKIQTGKFEALKTFYLYYIWLAFFMTYLPRVIGTHSNAGGEYWEFIMLFSWVLIMLAVKIMHLFNFSLVRNR
jgi:hypothetical protein